MRTIALAMTLLAGSVAFGQQQKPKATPEDKATRLTERMKKELLLTEDQATKVADINLGIARKNEGVRNNSSYTPEQKKQIHESNEAARKAMLKEVLTPEQFKRYEEKETKHELKREDMKQTPAKKVEPATRE